MGLDRRTFLGLGLATGGMVGIGQLLDKLSDTEEDGECMPALFVGHGSPMNALEDNEFSRGWREITGKIPKPKAILCVSAHWLTRGTSITAMEKPSTIHDFGGFPDELFQVEYPAPGSPVLAEQTRNLVRYAPINPDYQWGLDHGAWSVSRQMYPAADIPVLQLSIDYHKPALFHYELGAALSVLRKKGVLIIGSGNIIHNLGILDFKRSGGYDWAEALNPVIIQNLHEGNHRFFIDYEKMGKEGKLAIPTPDHFLPLLYILGLSNKKEPTLVFNDKLIMGSISMTSVLVS